MSGRNAQVTFIVLEYAFGGEPDGTFLELGETGRMSDGNTEFFLGTLRAIYDSTKLYKGRKTSIVPPAARVRKVWSWNLE